MNKQHLLTAKLPAGIQTNLMPTLVLDEMVLDEMVLVIVLETSDSSTSTVFD